MEVNECMYKRRSIREFTNEDVSRDDVDLLLNYAMSGPSACNKKPWEFMVVKNNELLEKLRGVTRFTNIVSPLIIVVCGNMNFALKSKMKDFWIQDCSAAIENILLGATSLNLGSCWCGIYPIESSYKAVQNILNLEENIIPLGYVIIGHPALEVDGRTQYDEERVHFYE